MDLAVRLSDYVEFFARDDARVRAPEGGGPIRQGHGVRFRFDDLVCTPKIREELQASEGGP